MTTSHKLLQDMLLQSPEKASNQPRRSPTTLPSALDDRAAPLLKKKLKKKGKTNTWGVFK